MIGAKDKPLLCNARNNIQRPSPSQKKSSDFQIIIPCSMEEEISEDIHAENVMNIVAMGG
jgi:hypothetical protein